MYAPALLVLTAAVLFADAKPQRRFNANNNLLSSNIEENENYDKPLDKSARNFDAKNFRMMFSSEIQEPKATRRVTGAPTTPRVPDDATDRAVRTVFQIPRGCDCPYTSQYNPVCGTDQRTYANAMILKCNKACGINVSLYMAAACTSSG